ncbi:MAG TPA: OmpA family protein [Candidatus Acidoferrum sp.]|nr:OmpA family protein [Candidatus Acidoferrum sp.]
MKTPILLFAALGCALAQVPNPTQQAPVANDGQPMPIFRVTVVSRTTKAINYHHRSGSTRIDFRGTELMPAARGEAEVASQMGSTKIETRLEKMTPPSQFGPEYMTYVMWAITPEGRPMNLGEVALSGDHAKLLSTTDLQTFGLIVTAEPYFAVTQPSDVVVAENFVRNDTTGTIEQVDAKYDLWKRGQYVLNRSAYKPVKVDPKGPLQLGQAENAVEIARVDGAEKYANDTFQKALVSLRNAQDFLNGKSKDRKRSETNAREAAQMAEDARIITFKKIQEEQLANERAAAAQREADAQAKAQAEAEKARLEAQRRAEAEAQQRAADESRRLADQARMAAEQERLRADQARGEAEKAAAIAAQQKAAADAAKAEAIAQQQAAMADADRSRLAALKSEQEKADLRERLRQQLNMILETRETQRGLIVNISDVLFDFDKYTLKPTAREKLAKVAGILLAYPGLKIQLEGHTDSIGTDEYNQKLSEQRAGSVRDYLGQQGVPIDTMAAIGLGKADPVASNADGAGRQRNRRVEMVVSGEAIGIGDIGSSSTANRVH